MIYACYDVACAAEIGCGYIHILDRSRWQYLCSLLQDCSRVSGSYMTYFRSTSDSVNTPVFHCSIEVTRLPWRWWVDLKCALQVKLERLNGVQKFKKVHSQLEIWCPLGCQNPLPFNYAGTPIKLGVRTIAVGRHEGAYNIASEFYTHLLHSG